MIDLFVMGGVLFMGMITIILTAGLLVAVRVLLGILHDKEGSNMDTVSRWLEAIKAIGLLALVSGILGQMIGLYDAFSAIEEMGAIAPELLAGGLKVSSITTIWGMICFVVLYLIYLGLTSMIRQTR